MVSNIKKKEDFFFLFTLKTFLEKSLYHTTF